LISKVKNIRRKIASIGMLSGNSTGVNSFLFLFFISYFIVGADISKDIAKDGKEFSDFTSVLEESNTVDILSYIDQLKTDPPLIGEASVFIQLIENNDQISLPHTRGPPQLA
jgi:hypothetical protein